MREKDGFSLIELVITIAIMGILVGLSAFSLNYISQADDTGHKIGKDNMKIQVDSTELGSGDVYSFTIRKKDGAFATVTDGGNTYVPPSKIAVTDDNGRTYSITVVKDTGRHFID